MKTNPIEKLTPFGLAAAALVAMSGCAGMTQQEKNTAIGAGAGAAGAIILGAGTLGTLGGAAVGGAIGHEINKPK
jgi:osmotically inducible lipoprotein OsmB